MLYREEVLDRRTGELVTIDKGDWISINELAEVYGVGPRKARCVLREMDFLGLEGANDHGRHRIQEWAESRGYGRRNRTKFGARYPFDVISPEGQEWIKAGWTTALAAVEAASTGPLVVRAATALAEFKEARLRPDMSIHMGVSWLCDHFPDLTHTDIGTILEVSQQLVSRYVAEREAQRRTNHQRRFAELPDIGKIHQRGLSRDEFYEL